MGELADLQIYEYMTLEDTVIEHEIKIEILIFITHEFLSGNKTEATPQFQKELLQLINKSLFQIRFPQCRIILKIKELQNIGVLDEFL